MNFRIFIPISLILMLSFTSTLLHPQDVFGADSRQKVIDFEGDVVEGVNKQPLDSLTQLSEKEKRRRKHHLYHKRRGFRTEVGETLREMRYAE
jgi:hypothetical protein